MQKKIITLISKAATEIPQDILAALQKAYDNENPDAKKILFNVIKNCEIAKDGSKPICQDTGTPIFYVKCPRHLSEREIKKIIIKSLSVATNEIPLRPNAVDSITGKNLGNIPLIHFEESDSLEIAILLKGGGSENVSKIYQLPHNKLKASRNLEGVKKCVLDAVFNAQGKGCPPYIIGVALGGNIEQVAHLSKKQLFRKIDDIHPIPKLSNFEVNTLKEINELGIGPLGLGGNRTALSIKIDGDIRHPATYFVGVSISCWCLRRGKI